MERGGYTLFLLYEGLLRSWQLVGDERRDMVVHSEIAADLAEAVR